MAYTYYENDLSVRITDGALGAIVFGSVIQNPDAYGGYNVNFTVPNSLAHYHVHFFSGGTRVSVIRHFSAGGGQGTNIIKHQNGDTKNLSSLQNECSAFPNHYALLGNFRAAIAGRPRNARNELI